MYRKKAQKRSRARPSYKYTTKYSRNLPQTILLDISECIYNPSEHIPKQNRLVVKPWPKNRCGEIAVEARVNRPPRPRVKRTKRPPKPSTKRQLFAMKKNI